MIIKVDDYLEDSYKLNMILNNPIKGILKTRLRTTNNELYLYYEISSKQTMERLFEKSCIGYVELEKIILALNLCVEEVKRYLLEENDIALGPDMIFWDSDKQIYEFCYYPDLERDFRTGLKDLLQYILTKVDHEDKKAVMKAYDLHNLSLQESYTIQEFINKFTEFWHIPEKKEKKQVDNDEKMNIIYDKHNEAKKKFTVEPAKAFIIAGLFIILASGAYLYGKYIHKQYGYITLVMGLGFIAFAVYKKVYPILPRVAGKKQDDISEGHDNEERMNIVDGNIENTMLLEKIKDEGCQYLEYLGKGQVESIEVTTFPFLIGRFEDQVDHVLDDLSISRVHAKITKNVSEYLIEDLGSTNGTFINNIKVDSYEQTRIQRGDIIKFARIPFRFN